MVRRRFATFIALSLITGVMAWLGGGGAEAIYMQQTNVTEGNVPIPLGLATTRAYGLTASSVTTTQLADADLETFRPTVTAGSPLRIALISSGVSPAVFPAPLDAKFGPQLKYTGDTMGYGTYASSVIFQLGSSVTITSLGAYPGGVFNPQYLEDDLLWVAQRASSFDAVLIAIPPSDLLDPATAAMHGSGGFDAVANAIFAAPVNTSSGQVFGVAMDNDQFARQGASQFNWNTLSQFRTRITIFNKIHSLIKSITAAGLAVVVPSGDLGPKPQTIFGIANLPEVLTVGSVNSDAAISPASSSGPTIDLKIKPDLVATSGILGLAPYGTALANFIQTQTLNAPPGIDPKWMGGATGYGSAAVKSVLDSTLTSSALVTIAMASLRSAGLASGSPLDLARQKGALYAKSVIDPDIPIWRQGQGVLGGSAFDIAIPILSFAQSTPLVLSHASLGLEPSSGSWSVQVPISTGTAEAGIVDFGDFVGVDLDAKVTETAVTNGDVPTITVSVSTGTVNVAASVGNDDREAGLYCGVVGVTLTALSVDQIEHIPTCLVNGFKPVARSFAIHNESANKETFVLTPSLPPGTSIIDHALHMLPINPVDTSLFMKVSDEVDCPLYTVTATVPGACNGHSQFEVVLPGYYSVRQFSDYGTDYETQVNVRNPTTGLWEPQVKTTGFGSPTGYIPFSTLLLPKYPECTKSFGANSDWSKGIKPEDGLEPWQTCSHRKLNARVPSDKKATYDGPTGGFKISLASASEPLPTDLLVNLGFIRKPIGTAITSRVIDIVHPCNELTFNSFRTPQVTPLDELSDPQSAGNDWGRGCENAETLLARLLSTDAESTGQIGVGVASYPFNLTTPNYAAEVSLNFPYEVNNAVIVAVVTIGNEAGAGIISRRGAIQLPPSGLNEEIDNLRVEAQGVGTGTASFKFGFLPKGIDRGTISFFFIPMQYDSSNYIQALGSWARLKDDPVANQTVSFEVKTWTPANWPPFNFKNRRGADEKTPCHDVELPEDDCGHTFQVNSRFAPRTTNSAGKYTGGQISGECRTITANESANVCEDWTLMVHSPKAGSVTVTAASLMDVVDASNSSTYTSVASETVAAGGRIYIPEPRTSTATVFAAFSAGLGSPLSGGQTLWTNGSFFEQLVIPMPVLRNHPSSLEFCINDGMPRWWTPTATVTVSSICGGAVSGTAWSAPEVEVPCIPKVPALVSKPCEAASTSYSRPRLSPYVNYVSTHALL